MKAHNGMRPHDIVVLLKIIIQEENWMSKDIAASIKMSLQDALAIATE